MSLTDTCCRRKFLPLHLLVNIPMVLPAILSQTSLVLQPKRLDCFKQGELLRSLGFSFFVDDRSERTRDLSAVRYFVCSGEGSTTLAALRIKSKSELTFSERASAWVRLGGILKRDVTVSSRNRRGNCHVLIFFSTVSSFLLAL
jgi:hypothetical protein